MIVLKILGFTLLAVLLIIGIILLMPVDLVLRDDKKQGFKILYRFFGKLMGEHPDPNSKITKEIEKAVGIDKIIDKNKVKGSIEESGVEFTAVETMRLIGLLLGRIKWILPKARIQKLYIKFICGGDAAETAINYGIACAVAYPLSELICDKVKSSKQAPEIDLSCDFDRDTNEFAMDIWLRFTVIYVLIAFIYIVKENVKAELKAQKEKDNAEK